MQIKNRIAPCLWFNTEAEEAANYYVAIFPNSKIVTIARYGEAGASMHGRAAGSRDDRRSSNSRARPSPALNGGPHFKFNEAVSLQVYVDDQDELDYYWEKLCRRR